MNPVVPSAAHLKPMRSTLELGGRIFSYVLIAGVRRLQYIAALYRKSKSKVVSRSACICYQVQCTIRYLSQHGERAAN